MSLVTDLKHSPVSTAWGRIISKQANDADFRDIGVDPTEGSLCRRFYSVFAKSVANQTLTSEYDPESQHILFVNDSGDWKTRFKPGAMRASYETFFYEFFREAGHEYGACPVATAIMDLSSLPPVEAQELNPDAFGEEDEEAELTDFGVMFEDLFNHLTASHLPKQAKKILPNTLLQPTGLVYGVIAPRMQPQKVDLVSRTKTMLLAALLGMRDFKKDALVGSRIIDSEEIMPEPSCNDYAGGLPMQRSTNSISSSGYDTDVRQLKRKAFRSSVRHGSDSDDDINFTGSEDEGPATLCPNSRLSSASNSDSESDEESSGFKPGKTAADRKAVKSNAQTVLNTEIHFPILGEDLEVANQVFTREQLQELKEFIEQLDEEALIKLVEERKITHRDTRLETLELDFDEEEKVVALKDGSTVLIQESGREEEFFPGKSKSETRLFTRGQIEGFKQRLSNLKKAFNSLGSGDQTNLIQVISQVVPSFGNAIQALEICRLIKLQGQKSGLSGAMERELQLDASKESFLKAMFGALGRREITVETGNWSQDQREKFTSSLKV